MSEVTPDIPSVQRSLFVLVSILAAWLYLCCGLSRAATGQVLKFLGAILMIAMNLGHLISQSQSSNPTACPLLDYPQLLLPRDVCHAMSFLSIEPTIIRFICCPKCFSKYDLDTLPDTCPYRETCKSKICGEKLWTIQATRVVMHTGVPWGFFCSPAPAPAGNPSHNDGCGILQLTLTGLYNINYIDYIKY